MNRADVARAIAACEAMAKELRTALEADAASEYAEQGTVPSWRLPGMQVLGSTTKPKAVVRDEPAFVDWVAARYPSEVETVTVRRVRSAWMSRLLSEVAARGAACDDQGEEIPGVEWVAGGRFGGISLRVDADVKVLLAGHAREIVAGERPLSLPAAVVPEVAS